MQTSTDNASSLAETYFLLAGSAGNVRQGDQLQNLCPMSNIGSAGLKQIVSKTISNKLVLMGILPLCSQSRLQYDCFRSKKILETLYHFTNSVRSFKYVYENNKKVGNVRRNGFCFTITQLVIWSYAYFTT